MAKKGTKGKLSGLKADGSPNAYWKRFKIRLDTYDETPAEQWQAEHILGHILKLYKDYTGIEFGLSYSGAPSKCKEIYSVKRMMFTLGSEEGAVVKQYIDWVFDNIIKPKNVSVTSVAFFFTANIIFDFKKELRKSKKLTRATQLPSQFEIIVKELDISTYGDLAFAKMAIESDPEDNECYISMFNKLKEFGFDEGILERLEA